MTTEQMIRRELAFRYRLRAPFRWLAYLILGFGAVSTVLFLFGKLLTL